MNEKIIWEDIKEIYGRSIDWEQFRDKTILISGPNGMLASYVMYMMIYLNEERHMGIRIIAMVRSLENFIKRFKRFSEKSYISICTDSINEKIKITDSIDYIIHAASFASPQYYDMYPIDVLRPNVIGTFNLLQLAVEKKVKGFLMFSTGDVYGVVKGVEQVTENEMGILDPLDIHNCYSESKRMAETMCYSFFRQLNVPVRIVRIFHTYAPTMNINKDPRVFSSFMKNIVNGQDIEIKSDGSGKRSFCYIADAVAGFFVVLTKGNNGEAYNICNSDQYVSIRDLAKILVNLRTDVELKVTWKQRPVNEHYTENTAIGQIPPSNKKLSKLGWETKYDIKRGFSRVLAYFKENE